MSQNYSKDEVKNEASASLAIDAPKPVKHRRWWMIIAIPAWVFACFVIAQVVVAGLLLLLRALRVPLVAVNESILNSIFAALIYTITLVLVIGVPWLFKKHRTSRQDVGLTRLLSWTDIWMAPVGMIIYFILSSILILGATTLLPWFDVGQAQNTGFNGLSQRYEYILAFFTLVILAPVAEELLFRGYLFGVLKKYVPVWIAILATSILFAAIHGAWNLAFDTFALSIVLCLLRLSTGSLWAPILLHMIKNGIAFFILFVYPVLNSTIGG